jgi:hypothetical protein
VVTTNPLFHFIWEDHTSTGTTERIVLVETKRESKAGENMQTMEKQERKFEFKKETQRQPSHAGPLKSFRSGALQVAIWDNEGLSADGAPQTYKSVTFERRYKDKSGEWKSTNNLRTNDLPKAILILQKAYEYLILTGDDTEEQY